MPSLFFWGGKGTKKRVVIKVVNDGLDNLSALCCCVVKKVGLREYHIDTVSSWLASRRRRESRNWTS